ncbi:MAG TPA: S8 family serine peptidase [Symbiobacteriaceae bacterium]|jgi:subtilisin family serine protease
MSKALKAIGAGLLVAAMAGLVPATSGPAVWRPDVPVLPLRVPPAVQEALRTAEAQGDSFVKLNLMVDSPAGVAGLKQAITAAGGEVLEQDRTHVLAKLPAAAAESVSRASRVVAVGINQRLQVEQPHPVTARGPVGSAEAQSQVGISMDAIGAGEFRGERGVDGAGVVVAVIDTGVDPGHPALQQTPDGRPKLIDWKDFTEEGSVQVDQAVAWGSTYNAPDGRAFKLPPRPLGSQNARFGFLEEFNVAGIINRDLDRNGLQTDRFGVLLVDANIPGRYDTVYVDTNNNGDFTDEDPLTLFSQSQTVGHLGHSRSGTLASRRLNFAVADLDPAGKWVDLGFDGMGHGTQVAGVLGANSPDGFAGVAPGAQIMVLKAMGSAGSGDWFAIKQAIKYAATHGADIINLSIGGLATAASQFDATASEWLNQITRDYGCLIVLASDNTGPGLSSGTTLGNPSEVMAVGAYYSPAMWERDYGYKVPHESIWSLSGMGPRSDGSYLPNVVAPGGSPTISSMWIDSTGYTTEKGTSIATPHVSGAAALLMQAGKQAGLNHDRISVKRALEMGARRIAGFEVYEQGNGLVQLPAAFSNLMMINSVPALKARTREGNGGLLARSYTPGSTDFWLTNLGDDLTRVSVYSSADWVHPLLRSLTLPPNVARQLPLELNPPDGDGVHSAFLQMTHQEKYGPSLTVPITFVRPIDLPLSVDKNFTTTNSLEVGRYHRYFLDVKPGTATLNVTARVPINPGTATQGTVRVHVLRPDGKAVYSAEIGPQGQSLTAFLSTEYPVAGTWEVVISAEPNTDGYLLTDTYTLEAQARPGAITTLPLKFNVAAGATATFPIKVTNPSDPFTGRLQAVGLTLNNPAEAWSASVPWQVEQKTLVIEDFALQQFTAYMRVEINNPVPASADLNLSLSYLDKTGWQLWGQSAAQPNGHEVIEKRNLAPGRYQALAIQDGSVDQPVQYQYRRLMGIEAFQAFTDDTNRRHNRGDVWMPNLTIHAPHLPGRYTGQLLLWDADRDVTVGWFPFEVSVGQPALAVTPMAAQLTRGKRSDVVLELRDSRTGSLTDGTLTVNGRLFTSRAGQVVVPEVPDGSTQVLDIEADLPQYQFMKQRITLPVQDDWGFHPVGIDISGENMLWHRKLTSQMP